MIMFKYSFYIVPLFLSWVEAIIVAFVAFENPKIIPAVVLIWILVIIATILFIWYNKKEIR